MAEAKSSASSAEAVKLKHDRLAQVMTNSQVSSTSEETTTDTHIEEEPQLKYQRLGGNVGEILKRDAAACIAVHERFLTLGTHSGALYVLDFNGNEIKRFTKHTATINAICVDPAGEFIASAGDDGRVVICSMYNEDCIENSYSRPILSIQLDPHYATKNARPYCCGGREGKLILNTKGFFRSKDNVIHSGEGSIYTISWRDKLIAWANDIGVKVYDTETNQRITYIARPRPSPRADLYKACIRWLSSDSLLIGWADNVKLARVKYRNAATGNVTGPSTLLIHRLALPAADLPQKYMEIVANFETDFWICGLAPFRSHLVALAYIDDDEEEVADAAMDSEQPKSADDDDDAKGNLRPELRVLSLANVEHSSDALTLNGFRQYRAADYALQILPAGGLDAVCDINAMLTTATASLRAYKAEAGAEDATEADKEAAAQWRAEWDYSKTTKDDDSLFYVLAPKDLIVARPRDLDDHISWLLDLKRYEDALLAVDENRLQTHTLSGVGAQYIDHLLRIGDVEGAAAVCPQIIRDDAAAWEQCVVRFAKLKRLDAIAKYVPLSRPVLKDYVYEMILNEFLSSDAAKFLATVEQWPPALYNVSHVITAVRERLKKDSSEALMDALAKLYAYNGEYEHTLHIYLRLRRGDAFGLIAQRALHDKVRDKVRLLCEFDETRAIELLVNSVEQIPIRVVVDQLQPLPKTLHAYLHALFVKDPHVGRDYHEQQIALYADHAPALLLPFLRQSTYYRLEKAYAACVERKLYREQVFILGRMGDTKKALSLIMQQIGDVKQAIEFVVEHSSAVTGSTAMNAEDDELWEDLIQLSLKSPKHIGELLEHVGGRVDPLRLIKRVPDGMAIDGLRDLLVKIIADYSLQCRLRAGCNSILKSDCVSLYAKLHASYRGGRSVEPSQKCSLCLLSVDMHSRNPNINNATNPNNANNNQSNANDTDSEKKSDDNDPSDTGKAIRLVAASARHLFERRVQFCYGAAKRRGGCLLVQSPLPRALFAHASGHALGAERADGQVVLHDLSESVRHQTSEKAQRQKNPVEMKRSNTCNAKHGVLVLLNRKEIQEKSSEFRLKLGKKND